MVLSYHRFLCFHFFFLDFLELIFRARNLLVIPIGIKIKQTFDNKRLKAIDKTSKLKLSHKV